MITRDEFTTIAGNGVWKQNTSIVQILGLCPLLATTTRLSPSADDATADQLRALSRGVHVTPESADV